MEANFSTRGSSLAADFNQGRSALPTYYQPTVDEEGILSWANNAGLPNPPSRRVKGDPGDSAYEQAVAGGYVGTEEQFNADLARLGTAVSQASEAAEQAGESATAAAGSASTAVTSASSATISAAQAAIKADDAAGSAQAAEQYASNAATSASNAYTQAGLATTAKAGAEAAQSAAERAQRIAESSATTAGSAETASLAAKESAESAATSASGSATSAATSAGSASTSAQQAASSASTASAAASTATTKANDAAAAASAAGDSATSASAASSAAISAKDDAVAAKTAAQASATSATSSASSASSSATTASSAATTATAAQTAAEAARDRAETAAESVEESAAQIAQNTEDIADLDTEVSRQKSAFDGLVVDGHNQNLFSKFNAFVGYLNTYGVVVATTNPNNHTTDFIDVSSAESITIQTWMELPAGVVHWQAVCFYDSEKSFFGSRLVHTGESGYYQMTTWAVPETAKYVRVSSRTYNDWKIMVQYGSEASAYTYSFEDINYLENAETELNDKNVKVKRSIVSNASTVRGIAHRGSRTAPENTIAGFKYAVDQSYKYIETDLQFSADGVPVLLHDLTINRTGRNADGSAIASTTYIYDITYEEALSYDFGIWCGSQYAGEKIPTLNEFLSFCRSTGSHLYLEVKNDAHYDLQMFLSAINTVYRYGLEKVSSIISSDATLLSSIHSAYPNLRLGYIVSTINAEHINTAANFKGNNSVFVDCYTFDESVIPACISAGVEVEIYGIVSSNTIKSTNPFVTGLTTDDNEPCNVLYDAIMG